jgi:hypothetical protein
MLLAIKRADRRLQMSPSIAKNPTQFFSVVGAAYVQEHHLDNRCRYLTADQERGLMSRALDWLNEYWNADDQQGSPTLH